MIFNRYVFSILLTGALSLTAFLIIINRLDPIEDQSLSLPLFFISLFLSLTSFLTLLGYFLRVALFRYELFLNHFNISLRQGFILSLTICGMIGLQILRTLSWWSAILLILLSLFIELYFVARN